MKYGFKSHPEYTLLILTLTHTNIMKTGIKLIVVTVDELEDPSHPCYALFRKIEDLDHEDMDRVYQFFEDMIVPEGFYAHTLRDKYGWWINFYKPIFI